MNTALALKEQALEQVSENAGTWMENFNHALHKAVLENAGLVMTGEQIRMALEPVIGPPHHHNAWGAAIATAIRQGTLLPTGQYIAMQGPRSHARRTPVYRLGGTHETL